MFRNIVLLWFLLASACTPILEERAPELEVAEPPKLEECCKPAKAHTQCPVLRAYWNRPPNIRLCDEVDDVSISDVEKAAGFWKSIGYGFGEVTVAKWDLLECNAAAVGDILIRLPTQKEISEGIQDGHVAEAKTYTWKPTGEIRGSDIWFVDSSRAGLPFVLEHELGHALGWMHCAVRGHVMNPYTLDLGELSSGLSYPEYEAHRKVIREVLNDSRR